MNWKERLKEILMEARGSRGSGPAALRTASRNASIKAYKRLHGIPLKQRGHSEFQGPGQDAKPAGITPQNDADEDLETKKANQRADIEGKRAAAERRLRQQQKP